MSKNRRRAFTLVELLVVIAVVAILIGVLLPALAGARESGYRSVSGGNLRSIAIMMNVYANDYDTHFPMTRFVPNSGMSLNGGQPAARVKKLPPYIMSQGQGYLGGFAGFFSIEQENAAAGAKSYVSGRMPYWKQSSNLWRLLDKGRGSPVCEPYIENASDLRMLQNPADQLDGDTIAGLPAVRVETINDEKDVVWHNISYLYISGLNQQISSVAMLGDETNHCDWGNTQFANTIGVDPAATWGTFRAGAPEAKKRGYWDNDNHADAGGNFAYTDSSVRWIGQRFGVREATGPFSAGFDPNDTIWREMEQFINDGTVTVQTID